MQLQHFQTIAEFWSVAQHYLLHRIAEHNSLLSAIYPFLDAAQRRPDPLYLAIALDGDQILAVGLCIASHKLLLSKAQMLDAIALIANDLLANDLQSSNTLSGVAGLVPEATHFCQQWHQRTGQAYELTLRTTLYEITTVQPIEQPKGCLRLATEGDRAFLVTCISAFLSEIGMDGAYDIGSDVDRRLQRGDTYIWDDDGPVSVVSSRKVYLTVERINMVYTSPEYRCCGYATAAVAALSQRLIDAGGRCFLFADRANPTANHIYQAIGYRPVYPWDEYAFV